MPESATRPAATQPRGVDALVHGGGRRPCGASAASFHTQGWSIEDPHTGIARFGGIVCAQLPCVERS